MEQTRHLYFQARHLTNTNGMNRAELLSLWAA